MKLFLNFVFATLIVPTLLFLSSANSYGMMGMGGLHQGGNMPEEYQGDNMMDTNPDMPWNGYSMPYHAGRFKIADLNSDAVPEIILFQNEMLVIMDTQGNVSLNKVIEGISHYDDTYYQHMGGWDMNSGMTTLEVADMDGDLLPEIVIMDVEKLLVLNDMGELEFMVPLPWASTNPMNQ